MRQPNHWMADGSFKLVALRPGDRRQRTPTTSEVLAWLRERPEMLRDILKAAHLDPDVEASFRDEVEEWREIPGCPDHFASNLGRFRRPRRGGGWLPETFGSRMSRGYLQVQLRTAEGPAIRPLAHRVILETWTGPCPINKEACHLNGIKDDNRIRNLTWATPGTNALHKIWHGNGRQGQGAAKAKLTTQQVMEIRARRARGESCVTLAADYGVAPCTVSKITTGYSWAHLPEGGQIGTDRFPQPHLTGIEDRACSRGSDK